MKPLSLLDIADPKEPEHNALASDCKPCWVCTGTGGKHGYCPECKGTGHNPRRPRAPKRGIRFKADPSAKVR